MCASSVSSLHLLLILLLDAVTGEFSGSSFLVDPCNEGKQVTDTLCVSVGTNVTIFCNLEDTAAAWVSPQFESSVLVSSSVPMEKRLNNTVDLQFLNQTNNCILSSVTFHDVQQSVNGINIMCLANIPGRSGANMTIFVVDSIVSVELIEFYLTTREGYADLTLINEQKCQFHQFLISSGSCGQSDYYYDTVQASKLFVIQAKVQVPSFSSISITACTEEDSCLCQTLDFDDFSVTSSQEVIEGTYYSVTLSFEHDVIIQTISQLGNEDNCNISNDTSKTVSLFCSDLLYGTSYFVTVGGMASLADGENGNLAFTVAVDFVTEEQSVTDEPDISPGSIAGIVIATVVMVTIIIIGIVVVLVFVVRKRRQKAGVPKPGDDGSVEMEISSPYDPGVTGESTDTTSNTSDLEMMKKVKADRQDLEKQLQANLKMEAKLKARKTKGKKTVT